MISTNWRVEEKGQRTHHSKDYYDEKGGTNGGTFCRCGVMFLKKRWRRIDVDFVRQEGRELVCPACRRVADRNPAGIIALNGNFHSAHETEIKCLINKTIKSEALKNPLGRVMDMHSDKDGVTITTTDEKLAEKIGREVYKSHGGELHFIWSHTDSPVKVTWTR